ncbi:hypothetical protein PN492_07760 [Dolichospermum circinale CS-537/01]|uniref:Uncharacterized protein n=1 Tax=Dolichospermum circinale CS-537/01 TaxID=3021739 RepID=A0ABT5A3D2_9CYAN|nr:hypothetical protein [Dolichospermum circinale]MDB9486440.1 hypothetical protein [Dolichospermum circinale CS-537/01]
MSILTSAINFIAVLCNQILSELIIIGSGTSQLKISLQFFENSLLPNLRKFEDDFQELPRLIGSSLDILETNLGNNSVLIKEISKIKNDIENVINKEFHLTTEIECYRDRLVENIHEIEAKDKKDLLKEKQDNLDALNDLEKQKQTIEEQISQLQFQMSMMIADPWYAEMIRGQVAALIFSKDSITNQMSVNSKRREEITNKLNKVDHDLNNCSSLTDSIGQLMNKIQGTKNELSAIKAMLSNQEDFLDFSNPSLALLNIEIIRNMLNDGAIADLVG